MGSDAVRGVKLRDLAVLVRAAALWPAAAALKRALPLPRLAAAFAARPAGGAVDPARAARLVDGLLRRAYRRRPGYCVERSLILFHLLGRGGHAPRLWFGVARRPDGALAGHAWVTVGGDAVAEAVDPRGHYRPTYTYPGEGAN